MTRSETALDLAASPAVDEDNDHQALSRPVTLRGRSSPPITTACLPLTHCLASLPTQTCTPGAWIRSRTFWSTRTAYSSSAGHVGIAIRAAGAGAGAGGAGWLASQAVAGGVGAGTAARGAYSYGDKRFQSVLHKTRDELLAERSDNFLPGKQAPSSARGCGSIGMAHQSH